MGPQEVKSPAVAVGVPPASPLLLLADELDHLVALASINSAISPQHSPAGEERDDEPISHGHGENVSATRHGLSSRSPRDVLSQLNLLETRGPQSWLEVSGSQNTAE